MEIVESYSSEPVIMFQNDDIIPTFLEEADKIDDIFYQDNFNFLINEVVCKTEPDGCQINDDLDIGDYLLTTPDHNNYFNTSDDLTVTEGSAVKPDKVKQKAVAVGDGNAMQSKHICIECSKSFPTKQKKNRHLWIHRKAKFSCEMCPSSFENEALLQAHRLGNHSESSPFVCVLCGKNFSSRQGLWEHKRFHHSDTVAQFHCDACNKSFASRQGYMIHRRIHSGERPYSCPDCTKSFRDGGTLRKHQRVHTGERPHQCPLCEKDFNQKVVLREHIRWVHANGGKGSPNPALSMVCVLCDLAINDREELCSHLIKHGDQIASYKKNAASNDKPNITSPSNGNNGADLASNSKVCSDLIRRNKLILKRISEKV